MNDSFYNHFMLKVDRDVHGSSLQFNLSVQDKGEACWLFEDDHGRKQGPHSLWEIYSWHCYGYLRDTIMVRFTP